MLHERANARGMASATYVSVLVRSHLRSLAPLPKGELVALKRAVSELGVVGRNLKPDRSGRANQGARVGNIDQVEFRSILKICEALRDRTKSLIKANAAEAGVPVMPNFQVSSREGRPSPRCRGCQL